MMAGKKIKNKFQVEINWNYPLSTTHAAIFHSRPQVCVFNFESWVRMICMISFLYPPAEKRHHTQLGTEFKVTRLHLYHLNSHVFVEGIKASKKMCSAHLATWPRTWWGHSCICSLWHLNRLPHIFSAVGVEVFLPSLWMSPFCLLAVSFQSCHGSDLCCLVTWAKGRFFGSG